MATNEGEKTASGAHCHSRHPSTSTIISGPLPTDSMVTVRLSDPPVASPLGRTSQLQHHAAPVVQDMLEGQEETFPNPTASDAHEDGIIPEQETQNMARDSVASLTSVVEDEASIATSGTIRSRSDTSGSFSSNNSAQVDWEELEKSEEKAPRDE